PGAAPCTPGAAPGTPGAALAAKPEPARAGTAGPERVDTTVNTQIQTTAFQAVMERLQANTVQPNTPPATPPRVAPAARPAAEPMTAAQRLLSQGRLFDAEERCSRALSMRPGDIAGSVGRIHAQIGAGMLLSASVNLRSLLAEHPEIAGVKYAAELLPAKDRA